MSKVELKQGLKNLKASAHQLIFLVKNRTEEAAAAPGGGSSSALSAQNSKATMRECGVCQEILGGGQVGLIS